MGISKRESEESDRPSSDQQVVEMCSPRRKSAEGGRYQQRSLPCQDQHPAETQQVCQHEEVQAKVQHGQTEGQRHKTDVLRGSEEEARGEQSRGEKEIEGLWEAQMKAYVK